MSVYFIVDPFKSHMSYLTSRWNEFKKVPYFSQILLVQAGAIF